jgi:hypothetical protein
MTTPTHSSSSFIRIANRGRIDPLALTLLGGSTKRDDPTQIGFFGSGLKYAIATLLREGIAVRVFSGRNEISITLVDKTFRGKTFQVLVVDGRETSITLDVGPKWALWECVRELWSNALDEGDAKWSYADEKDLTPSSDEVSVVAIAAAAPIVHVFQNLDKIFLADRTRLFHNSVMGSIYKANGPEAFVGRRGIRVHHFDEPALYHYDFLNIPINESREASVDNVAGHITYLWAHLCNNHELLTDMLTSLRPGTLEWRCFNSGFYTTLPQSDNETWKAVCGSLALWSSADTVNAPPNKDLILIPDQLFRGLETAKLIDSGRTHTRHGTYTIEADGAFNTAQLARLTEARTILAASGITITFPLKFGRFTNSDVIAAAAANTIILGSRAFSTSMPLLLHALLEEQMHLEKGVQDCTREMQSTIFESWVSTILFHSHKEPTP